MLIASNTSLSFWSAAVDTANYIRNRSPYAALNGCDAYPLIVNKVGKKFEPKNQKAFRSRDIRFNKNRIIDNEGQETNEFTLNRSINSEQIKDEIYEDDNNDIEETGNGSDREDQENNELNEDIGKKEENKNENNSNLLTVPRKSNRISRPPDR
ncbi:unnamed protein product [Brachionus calyciflorus]|uniref:Uncharacterized protein n=1 Tax=Brachionus calyciflorus TaxID=104777 RepID=A0A814G1M7_9BILA|nr:unnamed protein product [Brachionus calyciflorus]